MGMVPRPRLILVNAHLLPRVKMATVAGFPGSLAANHRGAVIGSDIVTSNWMEAEKTGVRRKHVLWYDRAQKLWAV